MVRLAREAFLELLDTIAAELQEPATIRARQVRSAAESSRHPRLSSADNSPAVLQPDRPLQDGGAESR